MITQRLSASSGMLISTFFGSPSQTYLLSRASLSESWCLTSRKHLMFLDGSPLRSSKSRFCCNACGSAKSTGMIPCLRKFVKVWLQWRSELKCLSERHIPRCYFPKEAYIVAVDLHGFSDASERAYAGVVYLRMMDSDGRIHISLVTSKTKVAPIKRLTIPRLELCGAHLLARLLYHVQNTFGLPLNCVYAWTDSTIVLSWLVGNPRRFKTYVGNRIYHILELTSPDRWNHVDGADNPADCASRGLLPSELLGHELWWDGPKLLKLPSSEWPKQSSLPDVDPSGEEREETTQQQEPLIPLD